MVDVDSENDSDSRDDIESWGAAVAWAEDYTSIQRWDSAEATDEWRTLVGVPFRYVTWQSEDETTVWDEIDSSGWATRHVEAAGPEMRYTAAASLAEVMSARDNGGTDAVRAYEQTYGVAPEAAFPTDVLAELTSVSPLEFVQHWIAARSALEAAR